MKIDRRNPRHWTYLAASLAWTLLAILLRGIRAKPRGPRRVLLYGHKLNGNLLPLYRALREAPAFEVAFLSLDPAYARQLAAAGESVVAGTSPWCAAWLASIDALVSDHGLHAFQPLLALTDVQFFDVWHGIPFKGFDADDFRVQHRYREAWVASPLLAELYATRFGFSPSRVFATGYARTDRLVRPDEDRRTIRTRLGLPQDGPMILFAPTWEQDSHGRSLYPFGCDEAAFLGGLSEWARRRGAVVALRTHLNSGNVTTAGHEGVVALPATLFPDTEQILLASDVLVCDWSSIAFDFLLLERPAVFLDVEPPFRKGFSLGPSYRYGAIAGDVAGMMEALDIAVADPACYWNRHGALHAQVRETIYGGFADGDATRRCIAQLSRALDSAAVKPESSR